MDYVDSNYYNDTFHGEPVEDADFPSLCLRAGEIIEEMSAYRITKANVLTMPEELRERVKMAVCAQIEYMEANGGSELDNKAGFQSAGIGKFSYSIQPDGGSRLAYAPRATRLLLPTGFLYRGGNCL